MENDEGGPFFRLLKAVWLENIPSYANKIFYSLGFLSMVSFMLLFLTGIILAFFGPTWWLENSIGVFVRSLHLWAVQAFVVFMILHLLIVFFTGGYRAPRRIIWVLGTLMFFFALMEAEFGYVLRSDFSSQWRSLQGTDLYNGSGLGLFINNLNYAQIYGIHVIIIPIIIVGLLFLHYGLVRLLGIAKPYKKDVPYTIVKANHTILFMRGIVAVGVIVILAIIFPSPLIAPITIQQIAKSDPSLMSTTLLNEVNHTSDTATYVDNIAPYKFDTRKVFVESPYLQALSMQQGNKNMIFYFNAEDKSTQDANIKFANDYFGNNGKLNVVPNKSNPLIPIISTLILMGQSGLYEATLQQQADTGDNPTYSLRFLSDTGVLEGKADELGITTPQYGMLREEKGFAPGAWWLTPLGLLDNTIFKNDDNQDRDGAELIGFIILIFVAFPYIPFLNQLPDKLGIYKLIWKDKKLTDAPNL